MPSLSAAQGRRHAWGTLACTPGPRPASAQESCDCQSQWSASPRPPWQRGRPGHRQHPAHWLRRSASHFSMVVCPLRLQAQALSWTTALGCIGGGAPGPPHSCWEGRLVDMSAPRRGWLLPTRQRGGDVVCVRVDTCPRESSTGQRVPKGQGWTHGDFGWAAYETIICVKGK